MALQSSGAISISQIRSELGSSSGSLRTLSSLAGKSTPDAMSEFYGYSAAPPPPPPPPPPAPTIYFDGQHVSSYNPGPNADSLDLMYATYQDSNQFPTIASFAGNWNIDSDGAGEWDRQMEDAAQGGGSALFYWYHFTPGVGEDSASVFATPPSGRAFRNIIVYDGASGSPSYSSYDVSASTIFASYTSSSSAQASSFVYFQVNFDCNT